MSFLIYFPILIIPILFFVLLFPFDKERELYLDGEKTLPIIIVSSVISKAIGFSFRKASSEKGMLFSFSQSGKKTIWNFGMRFPIDIFWIDKDGVIIGKEIGIRPFKGFRDLAVYTSPEKCRFVLEAPETIKNRKELFNCAKIEIKLESVNK